MPIHSKFGTCLALFVLTLLGAIGPASAGPSLGPQTGIVSGTAVSGRLPLLGDKQGAPIFRFTALQEINTNGWTSAAETSVLPAELDGGVK